MGPQISTNTQAILLLTAPLIAGRKEEAAPLLKPAEYNSLARLLVTKGKQPADLLAADAAELIDHCESRLGPGRINTLLGRGFLLSQAVGRWHSRGIWVISRADAVYPKRLKAKLKENAPPILYGCGEPSLLELGGLAVVGSRHVDEGLKEYTMSVGAMAAEARRPLISGAARGIDSSAMAGALECGGVVIGVMAKVMSEEPKQVRQEQLGLRVCEEPPVDPRVVEAEKEEVLLKEAKESSTPAERLMDAVSVILRDVLSEPKNPEVVAEILNVSKPQVNAWLGELVKGGVIEKLTKPVRYQVVKGADRLL
ncbi:MAG: DNA-protecting protein DprA [Akkermansiaceae bacterium]|nr:DNA-protecting protein DprA [Akkermansiaceae bacterium]